MYMYVNMHICTLTYNGLTKLRAALGAYTLYHRGTWDLAPEEGGDPRILTCAYTLRSIITARTEGVGWEGVPTWTMRTDENSGPRSTVLSWHPQHPQHGG